MESVDPNPCPRRHYQRCQPQNIGFSLALRLIIMGYQGGRLVVCACWEDILSTGRVVGTWRGRAILLMLVSVLVYSLAPLAVSWSGVSERPFLFSTLLQAGGMLGYILLLGFAYRPLVVNRKVWSLVVRRLLRWPMLAGSASGFDYALFVWSTRFVDVGVATVLFEVWPLLLVAATGWWFRSEGRFGRITLKMGLLLAGGLVGSALVVVSQGGLASVLPGSGVTLGIVLALGSAVAVALAAGLFRWGADLGVAVAPYAGTRYGPVALEMFGIAGGDRGGRPGGDGGESGRGVGNGGNSGVVGCCTGPGGRCAGLHSGQLRLASGECVDRRSDCEWVGISVAVAGTGLAAGFLERLGGQAGPPAGGRGRGGVVQPAVESGGGTWVGPHPR